MNTEIAVIIPTRNRVALLREAMDSVQAQSLTTWEMIVVDDGSDDTTPDEVARRAAQDSRIRYLPRAGGRAGANVCRNQGLAKTQAPLVVFLDSDDLLRPDALEGRVGLMTGNSTLDFAVFRAGVFAKEPGDSGRLYDEQVAGDTLLRFLCGECAWQTTGPVWRRAALERLGGFEESLLSMQDLELHVRAHIAGLHYICLPQVDHDIRWQFDLSKTSARHFRDPVYILASEQVPSRLYQSVADAGFMTWSRRRAIAGMGFSVAENWIRARQLGHALRAWRDSALRCSVPMFVMISGSALLLLSWLLGPGSELAARIVNKWKGWVRFRQEPRLITKAR